MRPDEKTSPIDPQGRIGHVHLKVADLERAVRFTSTVVTLADGIYEARAFDRIPILADAIQDAGCESEEVPNHCRQPGAHVRG